MDETNDIDPTVLRRGEYILRMMRASLSEYQAGTQDKSTIPQLDKSLYHLFGQQGLSQAIYDPSLFQAIVTQTWLMPNIQAACLIQPIATAATNIEWVGEGEDPGHGANLVSSLVRDAAGDVTLEDVQTVLGENYAVTSSVVLPAVRMWLRDKNRAFALLFLGGLTDKRDQWEDAEIKRVPWITRSKIEDGAVSQFLDLLDSLEVLQ